MMKLYAGIKDGKIFDITSSLENKRDAGGETVEYVLAEHDDWCVDDTWDSENNVSFKDSPNRSGDPVP